MSLALHNSSNSATGLNRVNYELIEIQHWKYILIIFGTLYHVERQNLLYLHGNTLYPHIGISLDINWVYSSPYFKYFGVYFDSKLTWNCHEDHSVKNCLRRNNFTKWGLIQMIF